jgi:hypothetical protein
MAAIIRATSYSIIGFIVLLHVLSVFNINLTPLLASAGVLGVGIGLGAQSIFKDMINGILILLEDQFNVGEVVKIASLTGTVEDMSLRRTSLRDGDGTLYIIPNSQIATVSNLSRDYSVAALNLSVDASADPDRVLEILRKVAAEVRNDPAFKQVVIGDPNVPGLDADQGPRGHLPHRHPADASAHGPALDHHLILNLWIALALLALAHLILLIGLLSRRRTANPATSWLVEYLPLSLPHHPLRLPHHPAERLWAATRYTGADLSALQVEVTGMQFAWYFRYPGPDAAFGRTDPSSSPPAKAIPSASTPPTPTAPTTSSPPS